MLNSIEGLCEIHDDQVCLLVPPIHRTIQVADDICTNCTSWVSQDLRLRNPCWQSASMLPDTVPRGGTLNFSSYVGSGPASTLHPKKYPKFQAPQKIFEILATPQNIHILYHDLKKDPKMHKNDP